MRFLIVEDNPKMAAFIRQGLSEHGHSVTVLESGEEGESLAAREPFDVIVLDVMLPGSDGIEICRRLRARGVRTVILVLTALASTADKDCGLNAGADDHLTKPFEFDELVARARALLRRGQPGETSVLRYADLEMDLVRRQVTRGGRPLKLTTKEFALLEYFLRNPEKVLTRSEIGTHVWDMEFLEARPLSPDSNPEMSSFRSGSRWTVTEDRQSGARLEISTKRESDTLPGPHRSWGSSELLEA